MKQISCDSDGIRFAVESIKKGQVIIFPTDTVYGIGCDPYDDDAIDRIFKIKKRDKTKQLPILGYSKQILKQIVEFDEIANKKTDKLLKKKSKFYNSSLWVPKTTIAWKDLKYSQLNIIIKKINFLLKKKSAIVCSLDLYKLTKNREILLDEFYLN